MLQCYRYPSLLNTGKMKTQMSITVGRLTINSTRHWKNCYRIKVRNATLNKKKKIQIQVAL